ncbi:hypothetical protein PV08_10658 [Exophiala spinifera]|uniref:Uncharacterized protein n=1 Tax=Exophiala spinifera TaxID=91928 RepID=A0A0D2AXA3_9EURO|nr:uncharacterized protein PV08_10658 [Exophiala spinifera]KIW11358.1 hypothetical protein PV08_10658 [Exophiala spinifera]
MQVYQGLASRAPSAQKDVYIFAVTPLVDQALAAISSADELLILRDRGALDTSPVSAVPGVPQGVTSLVSSDAGRIAVCAGRDGNVILVDTRAHTTAGHFKTGKPAHAVACRGNDVAVGSDAVVSVWDRRQMRMRWQNTELNDEITALDFHPTRDNVLLAGGDDGLVSLFDTNIVEEEDSLLQAVSHGPIHKAGFLGPSDLYALSSDQNLSLHSLTLDDGTDSAEPAPDQFGDLRSAIPCEYVIDVFPTGLDYVVACGSHSKSRVDLVKLQRGSPIDLDQRIVLDNAHGGEVVRSIFPDEANGVIFTAGEDGRIAAWRPKDTHQTSVSSPTVKTPKSRKGGSADARFRPY